MKILKYLKYILERDFIFLGHIKQLKGKKLNFPGFPSLETKTPHSRKFGVLHEGYKSRYVRIQHHTLVRDAKKNMMQSKHNFRSIFYFPENPA